jgi:hypothetical protein
VSVSRLNASASLELTLTAVSAIASDSLAISADLPTGLIVQPLGAWDFALSLHAPDESDLSLPALRALDPGRLHARLMILGQVHTLPVLVSREKIDRWRIHVVSAPVGERLIETRVERLQIDAGSSRPHVTLSRQPLSVVAVSKILTDGLEPIEAPYYEWSGSSRSIRFHESLHADAASGRIFRVEVQYHALDDARLSGWYASLGLGPYDEARGVLQLIYGQDPFPEELSGAARWSIPVTVCGSRRLVPHYDVWLQDRDESILREPYRGIIYE